MSNADFNQTANNASKAAFPHQTKGLRIKPFFRYGYPPERARDKKINADQNNFGSKKAGIGGLHYGPSMKPRTNRG